MIFVDDQIPYLADALRLLEGVRTFSSDTMTNLQLRSSGATSLFVRSVTRVDHALLEGTEIQFVGSTTAGIDHVDIEYLQSRNIRFAHAPGCNSHAVAEYVMDWIDELSIPSRATIGIVGFGHIGKLVARYARARGMSVLVSDPPLQEAGFPFPSWCTVEPLSELMKHSDVVTLHVPYTEQGAYPTRAFITSDQLHSCKRGSLLINAARGGILDERCLADLVSEHTLRAVLDVFDNEPNVDQYVTERIPFLTPHIAGYTRQAKENGVRMVYEAFTGSSLFIPPASHLDKSTGPSSAVSLHSLKDKAHTFKELRRLTPLREEHRTPPTWEELDVIDT
ncbi:MAG: 4-phosphoerythronate dehydrogenase [Candidatus Kapabacteria bacterium]|nr:4-phosphoerythronate dehydrogenase [Candidatus Kapabacteria bacterium]